MFRMVRKKWKEEVSKKAKLRTYITFKSSYEPEGYIDTVNCRAHRVLLAKLRGGTAPLKIEKGRYVGLVPEDRLCKLCSAEVEDEPHFCIRCNALEEEWQHLFQQVNKKFRKFESKYRDCIKRNGDKIGTQTCYVIST